MHFAARSRRRFSIVGALAAAAAAAAAVGAGAGRLLNDSIKPSQTSLRLSACSVRPGSGEPLSWIRRHIEMAS
ncbi:hypothetical protein BDP81DRAFT_430687 [Colletotrichum phormii]|uniref:Uncharacterized protein n=1 Tax=Colletotrichum phormii TaxID=359342 RepID=A0AAI9ZN44_9PEZI|nr:uncharacterized protein BDP81DRAFT_430687 [Colletotrichum phormii]KAK1635030.1 hypothetical protein BDP81DRAFT_430687 [Colletotrichum phormii]